MFREDDSNYPRPAQPLPYPMPHSGSGQTRVYDEARPVAEPAQAQPYYGIQSGRSPSDELQENLEPDRRESGMSTFNNQRCVWTIFPVAHVY